MTLNRIISIGLSSMVCLMCGCIADDWGKNSTVSGNSYSSAARYDVPNPRRAELEDKLARVEHKIEQKERKKKKAFLELQRDRIQDDLDDLYQQRVSLKEELSRLDRSTTPGWVRPQSAPAVVPAK